MSNTASRTGLKACPAATMIRVNELSARTGLQACPTGLWAIMQIKWTDTDPDTGQRRFLCAERFSRMWQFKWKLVRRGEWTRGLEPTREMWEIVLDNLRRRYRRREGVSDEDVEQVERILKDWKQPVEDDE